ncbi:MAG: hypothetical protein N3H30_00480 [Candidatus Micrarchaeota archaeon]|nr:hypothetical protein [Candidatus Micrarchaeota archaeon]
MQAHAGKVMPIKIGEFGKINPQVEQEFGYSRIETHWVRDTAAIALISWARNECLLAHITQEKVPMLKPALAQAGIADADQCVVAAPIRCSKGLLSGVLELVAPITGNIQLVYFASLASLGYSLYESVYYPEEVDPRVITHSKPELLAAQDSGSNLIYVNWELTREPVRITHPPAAGNACDMHQPIGLMRIVK